jgi:hypothetical protein
VRFSLTCLGVDGRRCSFAGGDRVQLDASRLKGADRG